MKIDALDPNIVRIAIHQEDKDPNYGSCLWAYFDFDLDRYMLNIQSDCGNAAYRWTETPDVESFLQLMARINSDYLMDKLFNPEDVDVCATIREVRNYLDIGDGDGFQDAYLDEYERSSREDAIDELKDRLFYASENCIAARNALVDWKNCHLLDIDCIYDCLVVDFTAWQKRIVEIFRDYVQPKIREIISGGEETEHENTE